MKTIFAFLMLFSITISAQQLDTIYANNSKNVALFFPSTIRQGITGASHFVFTYNREKEQYFGLLQAQKGKESNLLTVTSDGKVYSYILKYKKELPQLNYFIKSNQSIGSEVPKIIKQKPSIPAMNEQLLATSHYKKFSEYVLKKSKEKIATKRKKGIRLRIENMIYNADEVYLGIEIKNKSGIDFEVNYLKFFKVNGNKKRKSSYQKNELLPLYKHRFPKVIRNGKSERFVIVLPKFTLGDNERLVLELRELKGSRVVILK